MQQPTVGTVQRGWLMNGSNELIAFGDCEFRPDGDITMRVAEEHVAQPHRLHGEITLELEDGRAIGVSNRFVRLQVRGGDGRGGRTVYRLRAVPS